MTRLPKYLPVSVLAAAAELLENEEEEPLEVPTINFQKSPAPQPTVNTDEEPVLEMPCTI